MGPHVTYEKLFSSIFYVLNRLHKTKSRLHHWTWFTNTNSTVSWTQSIRQILLLTLDVPMLKKCASCPVQE